MPKGAKKVSDNGHTADVSTSYFRNTFSLKHTVFLLFYYLKTKNNKKKNPTFQSTNKIMA